MHEDCNCQQITKPCGAGFLGQTDLVAHPLPNDASGLTSSVNLLSPRAKCHTKAAQRRQHRRLDDIDGVVLLGLEPEVSQAFQRGHTTPRHATTIIYHHPDLGLAQPTIRSCHHWWRRRAPHERWS